MSFAAYRKHRIVLPGNAEAFLLDAQPRLEDSIRELCD